MKISGFTFIRNAIKNDYPIREAIESILPLCDEVVVAVGKSDDDTLGFIQSLPSPKIKIIETVWDDSLKQGGQAFAVETNKALAAINPDADWAFYIQGDEVIHEKYHATIKQAMHDYLNDVSVEGLLFNYLHFYGSYDYVGESGRWYRKEIRVIRNTKKVFSYKDAQGFRKFPNEKLRVKLIDAYVYHYGWVKAPENMQTKHRSFNKFYFTDEWIEQHYPAGQTYDFSAIDALRVFDGTHPAVIQKRIERMNWKFTHDVSQKNFSRKEKFKRLVEKLTGWRPGEYKNYKIK